MLRGFALGLFTEVGGRFLRRVAKALFWMAIGFAVPAVLALSVAGCVDMVRFFAR